LKLNDGVLEIIDIYESVYVDTCEVSIMFTMGEIQRYSTPWGNMAL
jgi:hypothetical protein